MAVGLADIDGGERLAGRLDRLGHGAAVGIGETAVDQQRLGGACDQHGGAKEAVFAGRKMFPGKLAGMAKPGGSKDRGGAGGEGGFHDGSPCEHDCLLGLKCGLRTAPVKPRCLEDGKSEMRIEGQQNRRNVCH
jgi:hypothetical protein